MDAPLIGKRDFQCIVLQRYTSYSLKYDIFLGQHYHDGVLCYVVGAYNNKTGELTKRHYNEKVKGSINQEHAKAAAYTFWDEFKTKMLAKSETEEEEYREEISRHLN